MSRPHRLIHCGNSENRFLKDSCCGIWADSTPSRGCRQERPMSLELSVIVPAFEEAENLRLLVPRLTAALTEAGIRGEVIIVDDNSSDDTRGAVRPSDGPMPVRLIVRRDERGLSSAVIHGMDHARGEVLLVMDADLSHSPEAVPHLYRALIEDPATDFVVGSRHVAGASV